MGMAVMGMGAEGATAVTADLTAVLGEEGGEGEKKVKYEQVDGSLGALGYVVAQLAHPTSSGGPSIAGDTLSSATAVLFAALFKSDASLAGRAAAAVGHAGLRGPLPLPIGATSTPTPDSADAKEADKAPARPPPSQTAVVKRLRELMGDKDMKASNCHLQSSSLLQCSSLYSPPNAS
jgi:hypothetical protein